MKRLVFHPFSFTLHFLNFILHPLNFILQEGDITVIEVLSSIFSDVDKGQNRCHLNFSEYVIR